MLRIASSSGSAPTIACWILRQLQHLYAIEARLREKQAGTQLREAVRASESRPILARLERVLLRLKASGKQLPHSPLGSAIDYTLGQWPTLQVFLSDGRIELDNNLVYDARVINEVMPPPDLCRVAKPEAHIPAMPDLIGYQSAA